MKCVGIVIADRGSAIVSVDHGADDTLLVTDIERLPFDLTAVADRAAEIDDPAARFVIDGMQGLGAALHTALGSLAAEKRWRVYLGRGAERQALVDALAVAIHEERFHFRAGLAEQEAMTKALVGYRRQVRDDGEIAGGELVVALLLAVLPPPKPRPPLFVGTA